MDVVRNNENGQEYVRRVHPYDMLPVMQELVKINSPYIMRVFSARPFINENVSLCESISEYINGRTLEEYVGSQTDASKGETLIPESSVKMIMSEICDGLTSLHKAGIIHRDINPSNIMLTSGREGDAVKIIDFDITREKKPDGLKDTHVLGTVGYAAPEQFGFAQSDEQTDIYACGVLLNFLCTGKLPDEKHAVGSLGRVVKTCTQIDKSKRFKTTEELKTAVNLKKYKPANRFFPLPGFGKHPVISGVLLFLYLSAFSSHIYSIIDDVKYNPIGVVEDVLHLITVCVFMTAIPYICLGDFGRISELIDREDPEKGKQILKVCGIVSLIIGFALNSILNRFF